MKKLILFIFLTLTTLTDITYAQDFKVKWSEQMEYKNSIDGFFSDYIGVNEKNIYAVYTNHSDDGKIEKIKIISFDKNSMIKQSSIAVIGFKENEIEKVQHKDLTYSKTIVKNENIYVFWTKINKLNEELYVDCFDGNLKKIGSLKKIYTLNFPTDMKRGLFAKSSSLITVLDNGKTDSKIIIGSEKPVKNQLVKFQYGFLEIDLSISQLSEVEIPTKLNEEYYGIFSKYFYLQNGDVLIHTHLTTDTEKGRKDEMAMGGLVGGLLYYKTISYLKLASNKIATYSVPKNISISNINSVVLDNSVKVFSLYNEIGDKKNDYDNGVLVNEFYSETGQIKSNVYLEFDIKSICKMYKSTEEEIQKNVYPGSLVIDVTTATENNNSILFISHSVSTSSSSGNSFGNAKNNITLLKIDNLNDIEWISTIERQTGYRTLDYTGLNDNDIKVISDKNQILMLYGSSLNNTKESQEQGQKIDFISLNPNTGDFENHFLVNGENEQVLKIDLRTIRIFENKYYIHFTNFSKEFGYVGVISLN